MNIIQKLFIDWLIKRNIYDKYINSYSDSKWVTQRNFTIYEFLNFRTSEYSMFNYRSNIYGFYWEKQKKGGIIGRN